MIDLTIKLPDPPQRIAKLDHVTQLVHDEQSVAAVDALDVVAQELADYPPELPGQRYQRTGVEGRGWTDSIPRLSGVGTSFTAVLENAVWYAPDVQGAGMQGPFFVGRWQTDQQVATQQTPTIVKEFEAGMERVAKDLGG